MLTTYSEVIYNFYRCLESNVLKVNKIYKEETKK